MPWSHILCCSMHYRQSSPYTIWLCEVATIWTFPRSKASRFHTSLSVVHVHAAEEARARRRASASTSDAILRRPTRPRRLQSPPKWKASAVDTAVNNAVNTSQCLHFPSIFCGFPVSSFSVAVVDGALARVGEGVLSHRMILSSLMWK